MKRFFQILPAALLVLLLFCSCGKKPQEKTVVVLTGPEGLAAEVSGIKLTGSPIRFRLTAGEYVFGFSAPGYKNEYRKIVVPRQAKFLCDVKLKSASAAALITSHPAGAAVSMKGESMGITPLVIRDLPVGEYRAEISMKGYASMPVTWRIDSERPVKAHAVLDSNMGTLHIESTPARARVFIDGTEVGETPYKIQRPEGKYVIRLEKAGCNPEERNVNVIKRRVTRVPVRLGEKPGGVKVTSFPAGAEVFINNIKRGSTPCTVEALVPGKYDLKLVRAGFDPAEAAVTVVPGGIDSRHFTLISSTGSVVFNVRPVGVEVFVNEKPVGVTEAIAPGADATKDFKVDNLPPGKHTITMFHSLGDPPRQYHSFRIQKNKTTTIRNLVVWIANCEITYKDNTKERGLLVEKRADTIIFSPEPGVKYGVKRDKLKNIIMLKSTKK